MTTTKIQNEKNVVVGNAGSSPVGTTPAPVPRIDAVEAVRVAAAPDGGKLIHVPVLVLPRAQGGRAVIDVARLEPDLARRVTGWYTDLNHDMVALGRSALRIGRTLAAARAELKPLGVWLAFLNRLPGMSGRTGDRFIKRWEIAQKALPESVVALATSAGVDITGPDERKPYGRFTGAVRRVGTPPPDGPDADANAEKARVWLQRVLVAQGREKAAARRRGEGKGAASVTLPPPDPTAAASDALVAAIRAAAPDREGRIRMLHDVTERAVKELGYGELLTVRASGGRKRGGAAA